MARPSKHDDLAARIRDSILSYQDGWEIPSVRALARAHSVAPGTVTKALRHLVHQGDIAGRGHSRRYVRSRVGDVPTFQAPYPAVAVISYQWLDLNRPGYTSRLISGLLVGLGGSGVCATIVPSPKPPPVTIIPGGIILAPPKQYFSAVAYVAGAPTSEVARLTASGVIVMSLDCACDAEGADSIVVDCKSEAERSVAYLAGLGHRTIAFLAPRCPVGASHWQDHMDPDAICFSRAMLDAKQQVGIDASPAYHQTYLMDVPPYRGAISQAMERLWRLDTPPTAIVCFDAQAGPEVQESLQALGLRCPADVSILVRGCTSSAPAAFTMMASHPEQIGLAAAAQLCDRLSHVQCMPARLQLVSRLVEGPTTGPAPSRPLVPERMWRAMS